MDAPGLRLDSGIDMHTYDWLLDRVEAASYDAERCWPSAD
jgi:hypothetical protein